MPSLCLNRTASTVRPLSNAWWLTLRYQPTASLRFWCFGPAGAGASIWFPWASRFAAEAELVALRLPGRETRIAEHAFHRMADVVPAVVRQLAPHFSPRDVFIGHSLGGLIAFETARALSAAGYGSPRALIVCGTPAPHTPRTLPPMHALPFGEFIAAVEERYGPIPREIRERPDFLELLLGALRGDLAVYETYSCGSGVPLDSAILALGGDRDRVVPGEQLTGWRRFTSGRHEVDFVPGGHFFPQENPNATVARIRAFLPDLERRSAHATAVRGPLVELSSRLHGR